MKHLKKSNNLTFVFFLVLISYATFYDLAFGNSRSPAVDPFMTLELPTNAKRAPDNAYNFSTPLTVKEKTSLVDMNNYLQHVQNDDQLEQYFSNGPTWLSYLVMVVMVLFPVGLWFYIFRKVEEFEEAEVSQTTDLGKTEDKSKKKAS